MLASRTQGGGLLSGMSFFLPLGDSGSGAVNTTPVSAAGSPTATFTRATTATTIGPTGLVVSVGSGVARSYYDPASLSYLGYLAEGARTNLCLQSEAQGTTWVPIRASVSSNVLAAPDGNTTADKLVEDATAGATHANQQTMGSTTNSSPITISIFLKAGERTKGQFQLASVPTTGTNATVPFDLGAGTIGSVVNAGTAASTSATIKAYPNSWYRVTLTTTLTNAETSVIVTIFLADGTGSIIYNGDGASGFYPWGAQLEQASFASSYIPTTTVAVTRNADVLTYPGAGNYLASAGSCYAELSTTTGATSLFRVAITNDVAELLSVGQNAATTTIRTFDSTPTVVTKTGLTDLSTGGRKRATSWGAAGQSITGDGATVANGVFSGNKGAAVSGIALGAYANGTNSWFGTIRNVRIWTIQLTDTQLQGITT